MVQIIPQIMRAAADIAPDEAGLSAFGENFVSWYHEISQNQGLTRDISADLQELIDGFQYFKYIKSGEDQLLLHCFFADEESGKGSVEVRFDQISDGQRTLAVLYSLFHYLHHLRDQGGVLCIDEPENFLALREIQPWVNRLLEFAEEGGIQTLLISHHPEYINYLACEYGQMFKKEPFSPVRISPVEFDAENAGISISEYMARDWYDG